MGAGLDRGVRPDRRREVPGLWRASSSRGWHPAGTTRAAAGVVDAAGKLQERDSERIVLAHRGLPASATRSRPPASGISTGRCASGSGSTPAGLIGPAGLVNDGLTADCTNNGGTTWTYNQGVIIGGLTALHDITGDGAYLGQAEAIAAAALRDLTVPPGILAEPGERPGASRAGRSVGAGWSGKPWSVCFPERPAAIQGHLHQEPVRALPAQPAHRIPRLHPHQRDLAMAQRQEPAGPGGAGVGWPVRPSRRSPAGFGARRAQRCGGRHRDSYTLKRNSTTSPSRMT